MPTKKVKKIYIPKNETQQSQFLEKYPEFDARGLKMAIIDGGIDVSLPGLQKTSTGLPKIVDCFDFTGNGIIDTSCTKKVDQNNSLIAFSGRELKIPLKWKNPSGEWHLGLKSLIKLFKMVHTDKNFERKLNYLIPKATIDSVNDENLKPDQMLDDAEEIDCIVWNDGEKWRSALISSANCDDLENAKVITNVRDEHDFCYLVGKITCCVTISEDGNQLQICSSSKPHGTKVSQVAASHYPDDSGNINGLAPGAQINFMDVSSGGFRQSGFEHALLKCVELGVNIINVSLSLRKVDRQVLDGLKELQNQNGTILITSAGNNGPLLRTTSSAKQEKLNDQFLFIGSLITPEMDDKIHKWKTQIPHQRC